MIYLVFIISIILHEFSHIIVGYYFGYRLKSFNLLPFGVYIEFYERYKSKNQCLKKIIIYLVGPITNMIICAIFYLNHNTYSEIIIYSNIILGVFNLLPMNPLDGGKILREFLKLFFDNRRGMLFSYIITKGFLCIFTFLYGIFIIKIKNITLVFVLLYLWYIDTKEYQKIHELNKIYDTVEKCKI